MPSTFKLSFVVHALSLGSKVCLRLRLGLSSSSKFLPSLSVFCTYFHRFEVLQIGLSPLRHGHSSRKFQQCRGCFLRRSLKLVFEPTTHPYPMTPSSIDPPPLFVLFCTLNSRKCASLKSPNRIRAIVNPGIEEPKTDSLFSRQLVYPLLHIYPSFQAHSSYYHGLMDLVHIPYV